MQVKLKELAKSEVFQRTKYTCIFHGKNGLKKEHILHSIRHVLDFMEIYEELNMLS